MNSKYPFISIVTPSFNSEKYIEECIQSVLRQNYPNYEHIIFDGGSTDGTVHIIKKYPHLKWVSEPDKGQTDAINKGFKLAKGEIITWLNSDDSYAADTFNKVSKLITNTNYCWIAGNIIFIDENNKVFAKKKPFYSEFLIKYASASIYQPNVFFHSKILREIGYPDENFHAVMDLEWYIRINKKFKPLLVDEDFAIFRWHKDSKSSSSKDTVHYDRYLNEKKIIIQKYSNKLFVLFNNISPKLTMEVLHFISRILKMFIRIKRIFIPLPNLEKAIQKNEKI